jgi:hypothetical protein
MGWLRDVPDGRIEVKNLAPGEERRVVARTDDGNLIGLAIVKAVDGEDGSFEVQLKPSARVEGRVVDAEGKPRSRGLTARLRNEVDLSPTYFKGQENGTDPIAVAADGRFRFEGLIPGEPYDLWIIEGNRIVKSSNDMTLQPGEAKDLGDLVVEKKP